MAIKRKNPQDATLRNINALKKRVSKIEKTLKKFTMVVKYRGEKIMQEPISLEINIKVTDGNGVECGNDTFIRGNLQYSDLVFFQGKMSLVGIELQKAAELKAKKK